MKTLRSASTKLSIAGINGIEELNYSEMYRIRGGYAEEKTKTKEIDVYDTRET